MGLAYLNITLANLFFFSGYQNYMLDFEIPQNFTLIQFVEETGCLYKQKSFSWTETLLRAENEALSICSQLCISSNCLCPVLYSKFEGHLGCFKVSFSSPTFAMQTSELQLLTINLRIIFELTKSKRDGPYLLPPLLGLLNISTRLRFAITLVGN